MHDKHRVVRLVGEQDVERGAIALGPGVADDIDGVSLRPGFGQDRVELGFGRGSKLGDGAAEIDEAVHRDDADTAAIGQDRQPIAAKGLEIRERLGRGEQFVEIDNAQEAGAAKGGVIDRVRAGERAGVRGGGAGSGGMPAGLHHHHRLDARRRAGGGEKALRVDDRLDIEQDRAGPAVERKMVEQVVEIDVGHIAERDDAGKADVAPVGPVDHRRDHGAGLGDEGEIAGQGRRRGEARIELHLRGEHAEAIRADQPHAARPRGLKRAFGERARPLAQAAGENDGGLGAAPGGVGNDIGHDGGRGRNHDQIGRDGKRADAGVTSQAIDLAVAGIDEIDAAGEARGQDILEQNVADAARPRARAGYGDRAGGEDRIEAAEAHGGKLRLDRE